MKKIQVIIWTPSTYDRAPSFIKKRVKKFRKNTNIEIQQNPKKHWNAMKTIQVIVWTPSTYDRAPRFIKKVTWPAIMRIFNEVWRSYSIPSKIFTQVIHIQKQIEIRWEEFKLSSGLLRRTDGPKDGRTGWIQYTPLQLRCGGYNKLIATVNMTVESCAVIN